MKDVMIVDGVRTPIGRMGGALSSLRAEELAALVLKRLVEKTKLDPAIVDDVLIGTAISNHSAPNLGRWAVLKAGFPYSVPGQTIERQCGSSLQAMNTVASYIKSEFGDVYIAGGCESHSRRPYLMERQEQPFSLFPPAWIIPAVGPTKELNIGMGEAAELWAKEYGISRKEQDDFGFLSQQNAKKAINAGYFDEEIVPVPIPQRKGDPIIVTRDEHPRDVTREALDNLKPAFMKDGTVTAGNSSGMNDGAVAMLMMSAEQCEKLGYKPLGRFVDFALVANDPRYFGIAPVLAIKKVLEKTGLKLGDMDVIECNEAFASQCLAGMKILESEGYVVNRDRWNPNGGAIAFGHPNGMSGARISLFALKELQRRGGQYALATICIGGGQAIATIYEKV